LSYRLSCFSLGRQVCWANTVDLGGGPGTPEQQGLVDVAEFRVAVDVLVLLKDNVVLRKVNFEFLDPRLERVLSVFLDAGETLELELLV